MSSAISANHFPSTPMFPVGEQLRTRQACDRCRLLKARCDDQQPHCSRCFLAGLECTITRRRLPKGYTEYLELRVIELEKKTDALRRCVGAKRAAAEYVDATSKVASSQATCAQHTIQLDSTSGPTNWQKNWTCASNHVELDLPKRYIPERC